MNERIKDLAEQVGLVKILGEHAREYGGGTFENTQYPELEKFAELIIRECMELNSGEMGFPAWQDLAIIYKNHFGVEE